MDLRQNDLVAYPCLGQPLDVFDRHPGVGFGLIGLRNL